MPQTDVLAAGVVVFRPGKRVLLVHRPKYDDWSFPKGKLDPGEHVTAAAVREVAEETGLHVRLGPPLTGQRYPNGGGRSKSVSYWVGRAVGDDDVSGYRPNEEIDEVRWVTRDEAEELLTYPHDRDTLHEALRLRRRTQALVVLRHGTARTRKAWRQDDRLRPLVAAGRRQAEHLVPLLAAYDVTRLVSSSSMRCVETVTPYADLTGWKLELEDGLSEEGATPESVVRVVDDLVTGDKGAVLCGHRPVLPAVFDALGVPDPALEPGEMLVVHLRKGAVVATERHATR
ncbi:MAG: NUDIX hydrolase [Nocardioides sp.]